MVFKFIFISGLFFSIIALRGQDAKPIVRADCFEVFDSKPTKSVDKKIPSKPTNDPFISSDGIEKNVGMLPTNQQDRSQRNK